MLGNKKLSREDWETIQLLAEAEICRPVQSRFDLAAFMRAWGEGHFFMEPADDVGLRILRASHREIIPIVSMQELPLDKGVLRKVQQGKFSVSVNRAFDETLDICAEPRLGQTEDNAWLHERLKSLIREAHKAGDAYTLEIWQDDRLAGGALGIHIGAVYVSLSMFGRQSGAGYAAFLELNNRLHEAGFMLHDSILPSRISRLFGGHLISWQDDFMRRSYARNNPRVFPTEASFLPARPVPNARLSDPGSDVT